MVFVACLFPFLWHRHHICRNQDELRLLKSIADREPQVTVSIDLPQGSGTMGKPLALPTSMSEGTAHIYYARVLAQNCGSIPLTGYRLSLYVTLPFGFHYTHGWSNSLTRLKPGTRNADKGDGEWDEAYVTGDSLPVTEHPVEIAQATFTSGAADVTRSVK
jgi:hypothetical protein